MGDKYFVGEWECVGVGGECHWNSLYLGLGLGLGLLGY